MAKNKIIGLTGPVAAGKDAVANILSRRGTYIIGADKLAHALYVPQSPVWRELVKAFGSTILMRNGKINRKKLGEIVFADKKKLALLNKIVHPYLKEEIIRKAEKLKAEKPIVINAAVLKEIGLMDNVDQVWVVMASKKMRLKRLVKKRVPKEKALKIINSQLPQKEYLKMADVLIKNEGALKQLDAKVGACLNKV